MALTTGFRLAASASATRQAVRCVLPAPPPTSMGARQPKKRCGASEERYALAVAGSDDGVWDVRLRRTPRLRLGARARALRACRLGRRCCRWTNFSPGCRSIPRTRRGASPRCRRTWRARRRRTKASSACVSPTASTAGAASTACAQRDADGKPQRMAGSISDIDARRRAEEALRLSEERYALALEASEEGHFDNDLETGEIFVSARVNEIYGFPRQARTLNRVEFLNQIPFHPDDRHVLAELSRPDWQDACGGPLRVRVPDRSAPGRDALDPLARQSGARRRGPRAPAHRRRRRHHGAQAGGGSAAALGRALRVRHGGGAGRALGLDRRHRPVLHVAPRRGRVRFAARYHLHVPPGLSCQDAAREGGPGCLAARGARALCRHRITAQHGAARDHQRGSPLDPAQRLVRARSIGAGRPMVRQREGCHGTPARGGGAAALGRALRARHGSFGRGAFRLERADRRDLRVGAPEESARPARGRGVPHAGRHGGATSPSTRAIASGSGK